MDIKRIDNKQIWEDFVAQQKFTSPFQSWNWGEFEKSLGNKFERFGIYDDEKLVGLIPVKHVQAKRGKYLHVRHGPILQKTDNKPFDSAQDKQIWKGFNRFVTVKAKEEGYWFVRMSPLIKTDSTDAKEFKQMVTGLKESPMHDVDAEITWVLDLSQSEEEILKNMRKNTRYYVRRAEKDGVEVIRSSDLKYLEDFWRIYQDTVQRQQWTAYSKEYVQKEFETFAKDDQIEMYLAKYKGEFIAAALILYYGNQAVYHHSGSLTKFAKIPASYAIQWEAIQEAKRRGLKWYNFWGISPVEEIDGKLMPVEGHPWAGLSLFKLGFGGSVREFVHAKDLPVSPLYYLTKVFETIERKRRGY
jgi:peptidoglycan pentaglycine glycine transferase (the first glycine)